jgi:hypothetical protein
VMLSNLISSIRPERLTTLISNYSTCFIFNLLLALLEIGATNLHGAHSFKFTIGLKKVSVHKKPTILTWTSHWSVRTHKAGWSLAWNLFDIVWFVVISFVKIS